MAIGTTNFPASLDTPTELIRVANGASSTVGTGGVDASATTIPITATATFPTDGICWIEGEGISYTGKTGTSITGCVRGFSGTAATHAAGVAAYADVWDADMHSVHTDAIIALETRALSTTYEEMWDFEIDADGSAFGTSITDLFGTNTAITTLATTRYEFEMLLWWVRTTAGTTTFTFTSTQAFNRFNAAAFKSPAAGSAAWATSFNHAAIEGINTTTPALPATLSETLNTAQMALIKGSFKTGTAGNFRFRVTNSAGTWTLQAGSKFKIWRMGSGNKGSFVA